MADPGYREVLDLFEGDEPTSDFVSGLRARLDIEIEASAQPDGLAGDTVVIEPGRAGRSEDRRLPAVGMIGLVAAVLAVVALVVITRDGDGTELRTDIVDQTTGFEPGGDNSVPPVDDSDASRWDFDITRIELADGGNVVAASDESAWIAATEAPVLQELDLETNEVVRALEISPGGGAAAYGFGSVWVGHVDGTISRIDLESWAVTAIIDVGGMAMWIEPGLDSVWLGNGEGGQAVRIDPSRDVVTARIEIGDFAGAVMENRAGVWIRDLNGVVMRIDPQTDEVVARIETPNGQFELAGSPDSLWAPGGPSGVVYRIDPITEQVDGEVDVAEAVGEDAHVLGLNYAGGSVWVRYFLDCGDVTRCRHGVARIDPSTGSVVSSAEIPGGWDPSGIAVGPDTAWTWSRAAVARIDF